MNPDPLLMDWMLSVRRMEPAGTGTGLALLESRLAVCGEAPTEVRFTRELILPPVWSERIFNLSRSEPADRDLVRRTNGVHARSLMRKTGGWVRARGRGSFRGIQAHHVNVTFRLSFDSCGLGIKRHKITALGLRWSQGR